MINLNAFDFDAIYAGLQSARKSHLTLCLATNGGWAIEAADAWISDQCMRIAANYSRAGLESAIRANIESINAAQSEETPFAVRGRYGDGDGSCGVSYYTDAIEARKAYAEAIERNSDGWLHPHFLLVIDGRPVEGKQL